jgi:hypothetical protein
VKRIALFAALLASACVPEHGPLMDPGTDCLGCHGGDERNRPVNAAEEEDDDEDGPAWTVAGTVYRSESADAGAGVEGAYVHIWDDSGNGRHIRLRTNHAGNFYVADSLKFPLKVGVEYGGRLKLMEEDDDLGVPRPVLVEYGGCNACHAVPPAGDDAPEGRISVE